jgi:membrane protease YdiL (CAAX protease family)
VSTFPPEWLPPAAPQPGGDVPPPQSPQGDRERPGWPLWTAFIALLSGLLLGNVLGSIVYVIADSTGSDTNNLPVGWTLIANLVFDGSLVASAVVFARLGGPGSAAPRMFGLRSVHVWLALKWATAAAVVYIVLSGLWIGLLHLQNETDSITRTLKENPTTAKVAGIAIFAVVIAPIVEELFFRGFVFTALRDKLAPIWAAIATGILFGLVHAFGSPIGFLPPLALLGTLLCIVYWKTGSIYPAIGLHCLNNCVALASALSWSWQVPLLIAGALSAIAAILALVARVGGRVAAPVRPLN